MQSKPQSGNGVGYAHEWVGYKRGIDDSNGFWLGLEEMHQLTKSGRYGVEIAIELAADSYDFVNWPLFVVGNEASEYEITIASDDGLVNAKSRNAGTSYYFASSNGLRFSSRDNDNDGWSSKHCATDSSYGSYTGWWYTSSGCGQYCGCFWNKYRSSYDYEKNAYQGKKQE